ncbi:hypothetical protein FGO68_gene11891 [Halteria grandinella]|uniref:Uncharacterized protein n=1 Tax=Halteria grandinella TaxID=5974 RepID=A0A8J8NGN3_HALGN|nr:hypothetical protein FGO68_gene11891 [Halteria grandinella]
MQQQSIKSSQLILQQSCSTLLQEPASIPCSTPHYLDSIKDLLAKGMAHWDQALLFYKGTVEHVSVIFIGQERRSQRNFAVRHIFLEMIFKFFRASIVQNSLI